jgi:hypothetical protein
MIDREGVAGPEDIAIVGDEAAVSEGLAAVEAAGATKIIVAAFGRPGDKERTRALLARLATGQS